MPIHTWVPGVKTLVLPAGPVPYYAGIGRVAVMRLTIKRSAMAT